MIVELMVQEQALDNEHRGLKENIYVNFNILDFVHQKTIVDSIISKIYFDNNYEKITRVDMK